MKPFKTLKGAGALALALFLFTSCSKNMDESSPKGDNEVAQLTGGPPTTVCAPFIGLQVRNNAGGSYFYVNDRLTAVNQQNFDGTDFSDKWLMEVSATGGTAYEDNTSESIGVSSLGENALNSTFINVGEVLTFKLGSSYYGKYLMRGADLQLIGIDGTSGNIEYYRKGNLVALEPVTTFTNTNFGNSKFFNDAYNINSSRFFDEIRLTCSAGRYHVRARTNTSDPGLLKPTRFYLADVLNQVILHGGGSYASIYVDRILNNIVDAPASRQTFTGTFDAPNWTLGGSNRWLKFTPGAATSILYTQGAARFGVYTSNNNEGRFINPGESITIEKGSDLVGFDKFSGVEIRCAYQAFSSSPLSVELFNGATSVGTYLSTVPTVGTLVNALVIYPEGGMVFDKVVVTGTGAGASIGGGSGPYIRFYPACN